MDTISYDNFIASFTDMAYKEDIPIVGSFELTPFCNFTCKMCYVYLQRTNVKQRILSGHDWIGIMNEAIENGMLNAILTGGEAMTHPDFWDIYMYLVSYGIIIRLKTNGLLLTKENIQKFSKYPPYIIDVSLYGCDSKSYLEVTNVDAYEIVVKNIRMAIEAGLQLRIMITPSKFMIPWIEQILMLAKSFGTQVIINDILIEPNKETKRKKADFDLDGKQINKIVQLKRNLQPSINSSTKEEDSCDVFVKRSHIPQKGLYCNGGRTSFAINWDGTMSPCLCFPRDIVCAHPFKDGFNFAWNEINFAVKNYVVPEKCSLCNINNKCHYCPTQHGELASKNLCDSSVCAYWHKVYE